MDSAVLIAVVAIAAAVALCVWVWRRFEDGIAWSNLGEFIGALLQALFGR